MTLVRRILEGPVFTAFASLPKPSRWRRLLDRLRRKPRRAPQASKMPQVMWRGTDSYGRDMATSRNEILDDMPMVPGAVTYKPRHRMPSLDDQREGLSMSRAPFE